MNLGIVLSIGGSLSNFEKNGQLERFFFYLNKYNKVFSNIYIFSYKKEKYNLPDKCCLVPNKFNIHRYLYSFLLPLIEKEKIKKCQVLRITQATGIIPAIISKCLFKKPFVTTYGFDYSRFARIEGQILISFMLKPIELLSIRLADSIIVTNKIIKNSLQRYKEKIVFIPNGVNTNFFKPVLNKQGTENVVILFVGRLVKQKSLNSLIEAVSFSKYKNKINLEFVGDGPEKEKLVGIAKKLDVKLKIHGFQQFKNLITYYQKADLFVLPSLIEGHPKSLLEAMSCGLCCIGSDVTGINDIIKDKENGVLFKLLDSQELSSKMDSLIENNKQRENFEREARVYIEKNFSLDNLLDKEIKLLQKYG